jgi:broad specificity phosphatase PhoE
MRQLLLIRHAITDWNASGRFQGHTDVQLSEEGRRQARRLGKHLERLPAQGVIYASPLKRALETAQLAFPGREVITDPRLRELHFGAFEGFTQAENERHPDWAAWYADPFGSSAPGGESYEALRRRAVAWMESLPDISSVVAVTHSGTIQMLITHILGVERPTYRKRIFLRHTGVTRILFRGGEAVIERVNDTRHLAREGGDPFSD